MKNLDSTIKLIAGSAQNINIEGFILCILASLVCAALLLLMYNYLYENKSYASGIYRSFLIIAPSVTGIFLAIQFSLPLSLGLLGALSFVRFRTPIRDPEEIGYLLLLISLSVCNATYNFALSGIILASVFVGQICYKKLFKKHKITSKTGHILITATKELNNNEKLFTDAEKMFKRFSMKSFTRNGSNYNYHFVFQKRSKEVTQDEVMNKFNSTSDIKDLNIVFDDKTH